MKITLKKLTLTNFKGIRSGEFDFSKETNVSGKNGSGKSTLFDSFTWLMFGKNSHDKKDFEIKTLGPDNQPIHKVDHEVEAVLDVDGMTTTIKRSFREKWVKPKGQAEEVFSGHETTLFWNDVPVNQSSFKAKIESLCSEEVFKMITNPYGFTSLHWKEQREVLFKIAGQVSDSEIAEGNKDFTDLLDKLTDKSLDELKKELAAKKKKLNDELKLIPARIDETNRGMPEAVDTAAIEKEIAGCESEIDKIESEIADRSKANESVLKAREDKQKQIYAHRATIVEIEEKEAREQREASRGSDNEREKENLEKQRLESLINSLSTNITETQEEIVAVDAEMTGLRTQWSELNEKEITFEEGVSKCPTCERDFEADDVAAKKEEMTAKFNVEKQKELAAISEKGKKKKELHESLVSKKADLEDELKSTKSDLDLTQKSLESIKGSEPKEVAPNPEILKLKEEIKTIQDELEAPGATPDNSALTEKRAGIRSQTDNLKKKLSVNDQIEKDKARIAELEGQAKTMGQEVADLEKIEFTMSEFTKKKIESIEGKINEKFSVVKWKMYEMLINGGEEECCVALVNGVPFPDVNTAGQINAGLDIIGALSAHYEVSAPIFVDHAESVNQLHPTDSQVIRLVVTEDEKLKVEAK